MSINPLNDISRVYLESVAAKPDFLDLDKDGNKKEPMKKAAREVEAPRERLKTDRNMFSIPKSDQQAAKERLLAKAREKRAKMSEEKKGDGNLANNYPPYNKVTRGDIIAGALGKDQMGGKKKSMKEGFSNWRQDLAEVMTDKEDDKQIKEKKVENKITINPKLGEAVEEIGGTLLEMVEIDEFDYIVDGVYGELLDEGYEEDDIEEALEYALNEAKVTFGHDTPTEKKRSGLMAAAKKKLASKVADVKKSAKSAVARGARKVAKGALGVARKMEGGDSKPSAAHTKTRTSSTYRGAGAGQKERVSSGSYTPPAKKKAEKPADPWEGSATTPKSKTKTKAKTTKVSAKKKKSNKLDDLIASVRSEQTQFTEAVKGQDTEMRKASAADRKSGEKRLPPSKGKGYADQQKQSISYMDKLTKKNKNVVGLVTKEDVEKIDEKTLTKMEMKKREEIVKSMKDRSSDFEKRYPGRGKEVMYATATKMAKKVAEQMDTEAPTSNPGIDKKREMLDKQKLSNQRMLQQKERQLQNQKMQMKKRGVLPVETN